MYFMCTYNKCIHKMITNIDIEEIKDNISEIIIDLSYNIDYTKYHEAKFDEYVFDTVYQHFVEHIDEEDFSEIYNDNIDEIYHKVGCQKRSFIHDHVIDEINQSTKQKLERYQSQINYLMNVPQPEQRTPEWYEFRYNHITGSNAWKIFSTDSARRQLYYEKLVPQDVKSSGGYSSNNLSDNPMNWGHKYEPLTTQFYEYYNDVKVGEFGCIPHKDIPFLAASPDGIVIEGPLIGRMLEIKNVVSREITGIPKMDYYVQMQIQMEVCDLDECDFVETKFTEFDSYQDFMDDEEFVKKGMIIAILKDNSHLVYEYSPILRNSEEALDKFSEEIYKKYNLNPTTLCNQVETDIDNGEHEYKWFKNIYWKLEKYSHVLVPRNKKWFDEMYPKIKEFWNVVLDERNIPDSYLKYQPKKRTPKIVQDKTNVPNSPIINNFVSSPLTNDIKIIDLNNF